MLITFLVAAATVHGGATPIDMPSWFSANDYPLEALNRGQQGKVVFSVDVDAEGKPTSCKVTTSSGSPSLDQATCDIVRSKGHFRPAVAANGKPAPGVYAGNIVWRVSNSPAKLYRAIIFDFSADVNHPTCKISQSEGPPLPGPTCEQMLQDVRLMQRLGSEAIKIVQLTSITTGDAQPYQGEPDWGERVSFLASEQYHLNGPTPSACVPIAAEGLAAGDDACKGFPGPRTLSEQDKKAAMKTRMEISFFGVPWPDNRSAARNRACKDGEAQGEATSCE